MLLALKIAGSTGLDGGAATKLILNTVLNFVLFYGDCTCILWPSIPVHSQYAAMAIRGKRSGTRSLGGIRKLKLGQKKKAAMRR